MAVEVLVNNEGDLDCHTCDDRLKEERGHYKEGTVPFRIGRETFFRCPLILITPLSYEYIKAYSLFEKGFLPNGNAWNEESNKVIQAITILGNEYTKWQNKEIENGRDRTKHNSKAR